MGMGIVGTGGDGTGIGTGIGIVGTGGVGTAAPMYIGGEYTSTTF